MDRIENYGLRGIRGDTRCGADVHRRTAAVRRPTTVFNDEFEQRGHARRLEFRSDGDQLILTGYASTFQPYEMYGGPPMGWTEIVDHRAFDKTLRGKPDLHLLVNHDGLPLARTKSGTLKVSVDTVGLKVWASLDRSDPDVQQIEPKMRRGDLNEMSFAFRVLGQEWNSDQTERRITEISLEKGDVSVVNFGANDTTSAQLV